VALVLFLCALLLSSCAQRSQAPGSKHALNSQSASLTYVAIGASDTFGTGTTDPYSQNWPDDLAVLLGGNIHLINLGIPGITTHTALSAELPVALDAHPDLVTIWLAVNDLAANVPLDSYSHDLDLVLSRLQAAAPHARIEVGNVPDLTSVPFFHSDNPVTLRQQIEAYNAAIASVVQHHHAILVDLSGQGYNLQAFPEYISSDGLHPSAAGYERLAFLFYQALLKI
jgi:acyl-CoA thioesterase I